MDPDILNNLYLIGGLLAAIFVIVWRLTASSQKTMQLQINSLTDRMDTLTDRMENGFARLEDSQQLQIKELADRMESGFARLDDRLDKVEDRLEKMDDRVRDLQMDMAVVKDRLNIPTDDRTALARAGSHIPQATAAEA